MSGAIDREEWRAFLIELLDEQPGSPARRKAPLARTLGVSIKTLDRWLGLDPEWDGTVSEASVRQVAEKTGRSVAKLFTRLGYMEQAPPPYPPEDAWIVEVIMASKKLDAEAKRKMIAVQLAQAAREREARRQSIEDAIDMVSGGQRPARRTRVSKAEQEGSAEINK